MTTLADFLLQRIAEDEVDWAVLGDQVERLNGDLRSWPDRVRAECAAKRLVVAHLLSAERDHERALRHMTGTRESVETEMMTSGTLSAMRCAVGHLALPYADHPDYDPAWAFV